MTQVKLAKIDKLTNEINERDAERKKLKESLSQDILNLFVKNNALAYDFDTLVGGILSLLDTLSKTDEASKTQHEAWKKKGTEHHSTKQRSTKKK